MSPPANGKVQFMQSLHSEKMSGGNRGCGRLGTHFDGSILIIHTTLWLKMQCLQCKGSEISYSVVALINGRYENTLAIFFSPYECLSFSFENK